MTYFDWQKVPRNERRQVDRYADADAYGDYQLGIKCGAERVLGIIRDKIEEIEEGGTE